MQWYAPWILSELSICIFLLHPCWPHFFSSISHFYDYGQLQNVFHFILNTEMLTTTMWAHTHIFASDVECLNLSMSISAIYNYVSVKSALRERDSSREAMRDHIGESRSKNSMKWMLQTKSSRSHSFVSHQLELLLQIMCPRGACLFDQQLIANWGI